MSSGFSGGAADFFPSGLAGKSLAAMTNPHRSYNPRLPEILAEPSSQIFRRLPEFVGKRSLAEFQAQQQQQQALFYLRNVKARTLQHASPISPLYPSVDFSLCNSPDISSNSSISSISAYGVPISRPNNAIPPRNPNFSSFSHPNLLTNRVIKQETGQESEKKMMNCLQELEKQLLDDDEEDDTVSVITNSEWSDTFQHLIGPTQQPISLSPTSSSSSCSSTSASPPSLSPKQSLIEAANAISEGKTGSATEILSRLNQAVNVRGTAEQRLTAYFTAALRSRVNSTEHPPPAAELYGKEHAVSTQLLYEASPCFKLGFMAANLAILEATSDQPFAKLHVVDFDLGQGGHYVHLIHALAARKSDRNCSFLKITTFAEFTDGGTERLKAVGDGLKTLAIKVGVCLNFRVLCLKITDLSLESLGVEKDEHLAVNLSFRLYKLPDESVTTENLRDELLRRVKRLSPAVVTVVEQEMNANTSPFVARVTEACGYYGALFDSLDSTVPRDNSERVKIEEGLGRKLANSVACEGRERVERCEVFGKWRARMGMAGFKPRPLTRSVADSLRTRLNSGPRGNPGFTVEEGNGGIFFGWLGRTLTVASAWQ